MKLKICGLREDENVKAITALRPKWMGFIFHPTSLRYFINAEHPANILSIPIHIKKVGVFVNESEEEIMRIHQLYGLDMIQLHGDEKPEFCLNLNKAGIKIIKAFRIDDRFDFSSVELYAPYVEMFLFDAAGKNYGGNGVVFNWNLLEGKRFSRPFLLSGGIGLEQVALLKSFHHPDMIGVDVNSCFELSPGIKDIAALQLFKQQIV
ncbi:MAG: phosphoribosylanthranilate isomerase [Bacteroidetes bacterium]|nr:phosphoribosylanthranilate isomerase [Bacteroidota bacterium]